jgi:hypothetical protein
MSVKFQKETVTNVVNEAAKGDVAEKLGAAVTGGKGATGGYLAVSREIKRPSRF